MSGPVTYSVRIATDAAMTNVIYTAEELPFAFHLVPFSAGLDFSTTYYWDVEAIDPFGASLDRDGSGNWSPSSPNNFATENSGNNTYGVIHGAIRGLTASNQIITDLTAASIAQTNNTAVMERVSYDPTIANDDGSFGAYAYTVWALPGSVTLESDASNFDPKSKTGINIQVGQTIPGEDFLLQESVIPVSIRVNNNLTLHPHHDGSLQGSTFLPNDIVPVSVFGSVTFDATTIDLPTVRFGPAEASDRDGLKQDTFVNGDGFLDSTLDFDMSDTGIGCSQGTVVLTGETTAGDLFRGSKAVTDDCNAACHN
jgi:hypothetical protein